MAAVNSVFAFLIRMVYRRRFSGACNVRLCDRYFDTDDEACMHYKPLLFYQVAPQLYSRG
jgi:hypothetical protein